MKITQPCKKLLMFGLIQALVFSPFALAQKIEKLIVAGPPAGVSYPLIHLIKSGELLAYADNIEFVLWNNPDQLRALVLNKQVDFIALPTNVGANLYNRGVPLQLLNVSQWDVLWMISRDGNKHTLADFKGEEIALPFRGDMPDLLFSYLVEKQGLDSKKDFKIRYSANPMDAMQLLILRRVDHALLAEPALSMALRKTQSFPLTLVAPELHRSVNLQAEWGRLMGTSARLPQAGIAVLRQKENTALVSAFNQTFAKANAWCLAHAQACAKEAVEMIPVLNEEAVTDAIGNQNPYFANAQQAQQELVSFFSLLLKKQPATLGGKLPDAEFYGR